LGESAIVGPLDGGFVAEVVLIGVGRVSGEQYGQSLVVVDVLVPATGAVVNVKLPFQIS